MIKLLKRKTKSERFFKKGEKRIAKRKITQQGVLEGIKAPVDSDEGRIIW